MTAWKDQNQEHGQEEHRKAEGTENVLNCRYWTKEKKVIYKWER